MTTRASRGAATTGPPAPAAESEWGIELLDLAAYLDRVGYAGPLEPSAQTLRRLHRAHVAAISFENLDIMLERDIGLGMDDMQDKLIRRRRGGYCHEQNLLFAAVLDRLGFRVTRLLARPRGSGHAVLPRAHATLLVEASAQTWLADVGFGGEGPLEPLPLVAGVAARQGGWAYRLRREGDDWALQSSRDGRWVDLYSLTRAVFRRPDFEVANYHASTHASSPFATDVVVQRNTDHARHALRGAELVLTRPDGASERRRLIHEELPDVLRETFGIELGDDEQRTLLAALGRRSTSQQPRRSGHVAAATL